MILVASTHPLTRRTTPPCLIHFLPGPKKFSTLLPIVLIRLVLKFDINYIEIFVSICLSSPMWS